MRSCTFFLISSLLILGPSLTTAQNKATNSPPKAVTPTGKSTNESAGFWEKLVLHPFADGKGTVLVEMPFPASWKIMTNARRGEPSITGPNNIKVIDFPAQTFLYTSDPQMQQIYRRSGQPLRPMPGIDQLVQQDLVPWGVGQGLEFVRQYEVPEVSRIDKWYSDQLYRVAPSATKVIAIATDWKHTSGHSFLMLTHLTINEGGNMQSWSYYSNGLQADKAHFETAKKQFLFGLANAQYNPQPIMAYNRAEAERVGKSWEEHNRRMAQNRANFEASQRAFVNRSKAINDTIMKGWNDRNAASDKAHEQFVDVITERTKVVDPSTGQQYKVQSGANQYWMNRDGEYFGTDNRAYDPNSDENMNRQNWQKLKTVE